MNENNIDKIEIETLEEKECLDRIPSVSSVLDAGMVKELAAELSENDKDVRIKELESFVESVVFTMEKARKHNTLTEHDSMMFREQLARANHLLEGPK